MCARVNSAWQTKFGGNELFVGSGKGREASGREEGRWEREKARKERVCAGSEGTIVRKKREREKKGLTRFPYRGIVKGETYKHGS